jgi:folate-binding protein YgfZ
MTPPTAAAAGVAAGYARLRSGAPSAARGRAALVWVEGRDAGTFLHGLLSNDIGALAEGESCPALVLDAKGHIRADMRVRNDGGGAYTLLVRPELADEVAGILERYHFSEDLEILGPETVDLLTVTGVVAIPEGVAQIVVPGALAGSVEMVVDDAGAAVAALGVEEVPSEALELARVAAGLARGDPRQLEGLARVGVDTGPSTLVQEVGLETDAVSFEKGCYLGQETVARVAFRGKVNRRLRGVLLSEPVAAGAALAVEGREVGRLTSVALTPDLGAIGLAVIRDEVPPGAEVSVEGSAPARVVELPFPAR